MRDPVTIEHPSGMTAVVPARAVAFWRTKHWTPVMDGKPSVVPKKRQHGTTEATAAVNLPDLGNEDKE